MTNKDSARWLRDMLQNFDLPMEQYQIALNNGIKELEQEPVLDKIRAEIERKANSGQWSEAVVYGMKKSIVIIDKYKAESEVRNETDN